ncbi:MAG TPA: hypothetical protein VMG12_21780, partial [Polyangiaceae bacterium]|nr:hypothetical protein [Polyangiaceae bacterium]
MAHRIRAGAAPALAALLLAACGNGDDLEPYAGLLDADFEPVAIRPAQPSPSRPQPDVGELPPDGADPNGDGDVGDGAGTDDGTRPPPTVEREGCVTPTGVSG